MIDRRHSLQLIGLTVILVGALALSFVAANYVAQNDTAQALVERFGYLGILLISIISGFNIFLPIPAATFTPIYEAAGFSLPAIIAVLVVGTLLADSVGYLIGVGGRSWAEERYQKLQERLFVFANTHHTLIPLMVFGFVAFMPLPNEVILIPLGIIGVSFRLLILPLILGNIVHQTLLTYGATSLFNFLF